MASLCWEYPSDFVGFVLQTFQQRKYRSILKHFLPVVVRLGELGGHEVSHKIPSTESNNLCQSLDSACLYLQ